MTQDVAEYSVIIQNAALKAVHSGVHDAAGQTWWRFTSPFQIVVAASIAEVVPSLRRIENLVEKHGWYAAGFISYEASGAFDNALCTHAPDDFPLLWFGLFKEPEQLRLPVPDTDGFSLGEMLPSISRDDYDAAIRRIRNHIESGDTYQVNYTLRLRSSFSGNPWHLFLSMIDAQPSVYAAYVDTGPVVICSASPELFFHLDGNDLVCKPMKGTVRRGRTLIEDAAMAQWLRHSEKNRAENLMIVDMIRNDLGRVADIGSVHVPALFETERHPTLWQMTSTVSASCGRPLVDIVSALFPCASITGAPKIRTTGIIKELEPDPRHLYTGCIGYFGPDRRARFNVAIRTAIVDRVNGRVEYGVGGGIVADSVSEDEYSEALLKAKIFTEQRAAFSLLETMLWTPGEGYFLLEHHLRRLADSAAYFDYPLDVERVIKRLALQAECQQPAPMMVRLRVDKKGREDIQTAPLTPAARHDPVRLELAREPVNSGDIRLFHKTTDRELYDTALKGRTVGEDVLLWNERGELTESCVANIVVEIDGELVTPPVESGLLAGTFRARLLEQGVIRDQVVRRDDLRRSSRIFLINSVRKWRDAVIVPDNEPD
jgi:para-aminobenzoate synthetase / 4-amino-4-deoxychorismate lyase